MRLRALSPGLAPHAVAEIDRRLAQIGADGVEIALAIESGSRAWGFPSPDSDYDCRFIFVRRAADYLTPWPLRDVIETPLIDDIDLNGWDLTKAIQLMLKGNAVVIEWLTSPIVYDGLSEFRAEMLAFADRYVDRQALARHYLHLGERQRRTYFKPGEPVAVKKLFYVLRPAAALRWLRLHPSARVPPMHFPTLIAECGMPDTLAAIVAELITRKAETRELGTALVPEPVEAFIASEYALAREADRPPAELRDPEVEAEAARFFRRMLALCQGTATLDFRG